jgi:hypothetical protein
MECAKNIILNGLEDVCLVIVSDTWLWTGQILSRARRARLFEALGKHVVPLLVFFFLVNNNAPYPPGFCKRCG